MGLHANIGSNVFINNQQKGVFLFRSCFPYSESGVERHHLNVFVDDLTNINTQGDI